MNKVIFYLTLPTLVFVFYGCSWVEYFVVINASDKAVIVRYELKETPDGLPIFYDHPNMYPVNNSNNIEWIDMSYADKDTAKSKVLITLPARSALVFGSLHNSKYTAYDQQFINGRVFNLQKLQINSNGGSIEMIPSTFDTYFKKKQGKISFTLK